MGCQRAVPPPGEPLAVLRAGAAALGIELDRGTLTAFERYRELLADRGAVMNLTGVRDQPAVERRHFVESLAVGAALQAAGRLTGSERLIDVGSGAGFPGIPLRLAWPNLHVTLLEATEKKAAFLQLAVDSLGLRDVRIVAGRAEEAGHRPGLRGRFDLVTARAVAPLAALAELTLPFARAGGGVAAIKGSRLDQELADAPGAISRCGGGRASELPLSLHGAGPHPRLLLIEKVRQTPRDLPRRPGTPVHAPLR